MRILRLKIENFRGIKQLCWTQPGRVNCFVGCGDSTKTTIVDGIELVLSPRWNVVFSDSDFYNCDYSQEIVIEAIVSHVPEGLLSEDRFGLYQVGWDEATGEPVELEDEGLAALIIELRVSASLEPQWSVLRLDGGEARHISSKDREAFGVSRLGEFIERHVTWSRGSSLARMHDGTKTVREVIADANRSAIEAVRAMTGTPLHTSAGQVEELARALGVSPKDSYLPGLDTRTFGEGSTSLSLHDGQVPLRLSGLGSRRLLAAAIQRAVLQNEGAILIDEVEHGLEPHRIVHLLRTLTMGEAETSPQLFMTTHSPVAVAELGASGLAVVHNEAGIVKVTNVPTSNDFAGLVRACPASLLGKSVIVCEGPTECGICWALDETTQATRGSYGLLGVAIANGMGRTQGPGRAISLASLDFRTAFFGDSDEAPDPDEATMTAGGVHPFLWSGGVCTEQRLALDLPIEGLDAILDLARESTEDTSLLAQINSRLPNGSPAFAFGVNAWLAGGGNEQALRIAVGLAANKNKWFKHYEEGKQLGRIVLMHVNLDHPTSPAAELLAALRDWATPPPPHA